MIPEFLEEKMCQNKGKTPVYPKNIEKTLKI